MSNPAAATNDTRTEFERMVAGEPYHWSEPTVREKAIAGAAKCKALNAAKTEEEQKKLAKEFLSSDPEAKFHITMPFFCEYGENIKMGDGVYIGPQCTFLDVCPITIGDRTLIGPNVCIYTPVHPLNPEARNGTKGQEWARPVVIGRDCWLGGSVIINGGITIGEGTTIGAGSVVTKNIPPRVFAAGNPARVIKSVDGHVDQFGPKLD